MALDKHLFLVMVRRCFHCADASLRQLGNKQYCMHHNDTYMHTRTNKHTADAVAQVTYVYIWDSYSGTCTLDTYTWHLYTKLCVLVQTRTLVYTVHTYPRSKSRCLMQFPCKEAVKSCKCQQQHSRMWVAPSSTQYFHSADHIPFACTAIW